MIPTQKGSQRYNMNHVRNRQEIWNSSLKEGIEGGGSEGINLSRGRLCIHIPTIQFVVYIFQFTVSQARIIIDALFQASRSCGSIILKHSKNIIMEGVQEGSYIPSKSMLSGIGRFGCILVGRSLISPKTSNKGCAVDQLKRQNILPRSELL